MLLLSVVSTNLIVGDTAGVITGLTLSATHRLLGIVTDIVTVVGTNLVAGLFAGVVTESWRPTLTKAHGLLGVVAVVTFVGTTLVVGLFEELSRSQL